MLDIFNPPATWLTPKKLIIFACLLLSSPLYPQTKAPKNNFYIEGKIEHFGDGLLVATITGNLDNATMLDSIVVKNNVFKHKGYTAYRQVISYIAADDRFARYRKVVKDGDSVSVDFADKKLKSLEIVAFPGAHIRVSGAAGKYLDAYPAGDSENVKLAALNRQTYPLLDELGNIDYSNRKTIRAALEKEERLVDSVTAFEDGFIKSNPSSIAASYIVLQRFKALIKKDSAKAGSLLNLLKPLKNDVYYQYMLLLQQNNNKNVALTVGDTFPGFTSKQVYNDTAFLLSQTNGKYRLLDFWGSWCIPCVKEMQKLKAFYEKHKNEVAVIGIANDNYQSWKTFLNKNTYNWVQILDEGPLKLSDMLNIESYPTKYLIDPSGKVLMIFKDADETIWEKIETMIQ